MDYIIKYNADNRAFVLHDKSGDMVPGQAASTLNAESRDLHTLTVTFYVGDAGIPIEGIHDEGE